MRSILITGAGSGIAPAWPPFLPPTATTCW